MRTIAAGNGAGKARAPCFSARSAARLGAGRHGSGGAGCDSDDGLEDSRNPSPITRRRLSAGLLGRGRLRSDYRRSKTDQEGEGQSSYLSVQTVKALDAIRPEEARAAASIFGLNPAQIGKRVAAAASAAGLGEGFNGHSGRVGMAQDLAAAGAELPALMQAGGWKSAQMPARYTAKQAAARGAVAQFYSQ